MKKLIIFLLALPLLSFGQRLSDLPAADTTGTGDIFVLVQGGTTKKITYDSLGFYLNKNSSYWTKTGNNIENNNSGKVILPGDSTFFDVMPDVGTKVGRILHVNQYKEIEYITPTSLGDRIDSGRAASPTGYSQWVRDSVALTTTIAHSTDTVIIGNTLMFSADKTAIIKTSSGYFMAGAYSAGSGSAGIGIGTDAFKNWTGFGGANIGIGYQSLYGADSTSSVISIGGYAGSNANNLTVSTLMGISAGQGASGTGNCFIGNNAGGIDLLSDYVNGNYLLGVGHEALAGADASNVNAFGYDAGFSSTGSLSNYIGRTCGSGNDGSSCNFIGEACGVDNTANYVIGLGFEAGKLNSDSAVYILKYNNLNTTALHKGYFITGLNVFPHVQIDSSLVVKDSAYFFNKASTFMTSNGSDFKIENTPAAGDISIVGYTNSTGVQAFHFDGDAGEIGIGTNAPTNDIDLTGDTDIHGAASISGDLNVNSYNIDAADTINTGSISFTDPTVWMDSFRKRPFYMTDFLTPTAGTTDPWYGTGVASGIIGGPSGASSLNHPGLVRVISSTTTNSGYRVMTDVTVITGVRGYEISNLIFRPSVLDSVTTRFGFHDATTITAPIDGVYFEIGPDSVLWGKTMKASVPSTTGTSYTLSVNTYYRLKLVVNSNATRVDYYVYNDSGTQLWTDGITTNIPDDGVGHGLITTKEHTGAGAGIILMHVDYMDVYLGNLTR